MKTLIASFASLLVGLAIGSYLGYRCYDRHVTNEAVQQMLRQMESSDRLGAARGMRAIELIQSGHTQEVAQMFFAPIADFYSQYAKLAHNDERTKQLLATIEWFAKTNPAVAAQMEYDETNAEVR